MRLASAGILALALILSACRTSGIHPMGDKDLAAKLRDLGIEGKSYVNDLGQVSSIHLGRVHVCGSDLLIEDIHGHLTYVDGATLLARWEFYGLPRAFDVRPDCTPSAVVGLSGGKLFVINRANGTTDVEPRMVDVIPSGAPVATEQAIYVPTFPTPSGNRTIFAISLGSGFQGWGWRTDHDVVGALAKGGPGAGDQFYFATTDGMVFGFPTYSATERTPEPAWAISVHGGVADDLALDGDDLAVVTTDGRLALLDRATGGARWEAYPGVHEHAEGSGQFSKSLVFYNVGGELRAFDRATGVKQWAIHGAKRFIAERGGRILLDGGGDMVLSVDKKTGKVMNGVVLHGWTLPSRVEPDATIFAVSRNGAVVAIEAGF